jgi:hypothetical protein
LKTLERVVQGRVVDAMLSAAAAAAPAAAAALSIRCCSWPRPWINSFAFICDAGEHCPQSLCNNHPGVQVLHHAAAAAAVDDNDNDDTACVCCCMLLLLLLLQRLAHATPTLHCSGA